MGERLEPQRQITTKQMLEICGLTLLEDWAYEQRVQRTTFSPDHGQSTIKITDSFQTFIETTNGRILVTLNKHSQSDVEIPYPFEIIVTPIWNEQESRVFLIGITESRKGKKEFEKACEFYSDLQERTQNKTQPDEHPVNTQDLIEMPKPLDEVLVDLYREASRH